MIENEKTHSAKYQVLYNRLTNGTPFTTDTAQARITALADALEITQEEADELAALAKAAGNERRDAGGARRCARTGERRHHPDDGRYDWRVKVMKTLNAIKMKIMVRAFRIRIRNGEDFTDIAADYPALTADDLDAIRDALNAA